MNDFKDEQTNTIYNILVLSLAFLAIIPNTISMLSLNLFKLRKSKEDCMNIEKLCFNILLYLSFFVICLIRIISGEDYITSTFTTIQVYVMSICLLGIGFINAKIYYEKFMKFYDSKFLVYDFISQRSKNYAYEISYGLTALILTFISFKFLNIEDLIHSNSVTSLDMNRTNSGFNSTLDFLGHSDIINVINNNFSNYQGAVYNYSWKALFQKNLTVHNNVDDILSQKYLISSLLVVYPLLIILSIVSFIFKIKQLKLFKSLVQDFAYDNQLIDDITQKGMIELFDIIFIVLNFLYYAFSVCMMVIIFVQKQKYPAYDIDQELDIYLKTISVYFIFTGFTEALFTMFYISRTDFYKYTLGNTIFARFYSMFAPEVVEKPTISLDSTINNFNNNFKERAKELNSTCLYFHNNLSFSLDEVFINIFDNNLNIVFATIIKIFKDKLSKLPYCAISKSTDNLNNEIDRKRSENQESTNNNKNSNNNIILESSNTGSTSNLITGSSNRAMDDNNNNRKRFFSEDGVDEDFIQKQPNSKNHKGSSLKENELTQDLLQANQNNKSSRNQRNNYKIYNYCINQKKNDFPEDKFLKLLNLDEDKSHYSNRNSNCNSNNKLVYDPSSKKLEENFIVDLKKNQQQDNLSEYNLDINLNIVTKVYYEKEFEQVLSSKRIDYSLIEKSFLSHYSPQQQYFSSLFGLNSRADLFKKQENLVIRTSDKLYNFEFLNSCSDNLEEDNAENGNLSNYIRYLKSNENSFLPYIIGVFKIKINNFKEIKVVVSKNNLVEEIPKENFNYWQMVRIKENDSFEMISSSKDRQSLLVSDEVLIKSDSKFSLTNYNDFCKIFYSDLQFLRRINSANYSLLMMYYEIGKNTAHNSQNSQCEDDLRLFKEKYGRISNTSANMNNTNNNISAIKPIFENSNFDFSLKNDINLIQIRNGFMSNLNDFRCILFFLFDNIFKKRKTFDFSNLFNSNKHEEFELIARTKFFDARD